MDKMLYVAMTGAKQVMQAQGINNHNIANANTTGFRADLHGFGSFPIYGDGYPTRVNAVVEDSGFDESAGTLENTGRDLDVAVFGSGWIAVQDANGKEAYTRMGNLQVTATGVLQTAAGQPVLGDGGPVTMPPSTQITVGGDGTISVVPQGLGPETVSSVARIKLVDPDRKALVKGDDGLLRLKSGETAPASADVKLVSGALESSNVNLPQALISMIELSRLFDLEVRAMSTAEQNEAIATKLLSLT
ncbi:MAG: flagellar basal body rod protein FlgF [Steroidobacterales bacterium]